ncbi:MAG TPA: type I 3-dehydroquinate dehydratase [Dissulfurispiraceae bacterium]|nr:type I 3-dehydroquinate dehydratase [Dissulfurispiraceae bacterium]
MTRLNNLRIGSLRLGDSPAIAGVLTDRDVLSLGAGDVEGADLLELRVDMFDNLDIAHVTSVFRSAAEIFRKPLLATVRAVEEGGQKEIPDRLALYSTVLPIADAADVEIASSELFPSVAELCHALGRILIGSYHNFAGSPGDAFLEEIVRRGKALGADIVKIALTAVSRDDTARLMSFTYRHRETPVITMSMGDAGLPSRVLSPILGSLVTYGYIRQPSAPGQLSVTELLDLFQRLKVR